jgi:hypothetical protein
VHDRDLRLVVGNAPTPRFQSASTEPPANCRLSTRMFGPNSASGDKLGRSSKTTSRVRATTSTIFIGRRVRDIEARPRGLHALGCCRCSLAAITAQRRVYNIQRRPGRLPGAPLREWPQDPSCRDARSVLPKTPKCEDPAGERSARSGHQHRYV